MQQPQSRRPEGLPLWAALARHPAAARQRVTRGRYTGHDPMLVHCTSMATCAIDCTNAPWQGPQSGHMGRSHGAYRLPRAGGGDWGFADMPRIQAAILRSTLARGVL